MTYVCIHKLQELLADGFEHFESLDSFEKAIFVLGSELWEDDFRFMLDLLNDYYVVHAWELGSDQTLVFHSPSLKTHSGNWEV